MDKAIIGETEMADMDAQICRLQHELDKLQCKYDNLLNASSGYEEILDEDLFEDGELDRKEVEEKIVNRVLNIGDWIVVRRNNGR